MSKLNINIESGGQEYTVSEMRIRLAQVLSKLNGDQKVTFSFRAELSDYRPAPQIVSVPKVLPKGPGYATYLTNAVYGELARPEND